MELCFRVTLCELLMDDLFHTHTSYKHTLTVQQAIPGRQAKLSDDLMEYARICGDAAPHLNCSPFPVKQLDMLVVRKRRNYGTAQPSRSASSHIAGGEHTSTHTCNIQTCCADLPTASARRQCNQES